MSTCLQIHHGNLLALGCSTSVYALTTYLILAGHVNLNIVTHGRDFRRYYGGCDVVGRRQSLRVGTRAELVVPVAARRVLEVHALLVDLANDAEALDNGC